MQIYRNFYFWRTTMQQEIDPIEESAGLFSAYEIKFKPRKTPLVSKTFTAAYPLKAHNLISRENYHDYLAKATLDIGDQ